MYYYIDEMEYLKKCRRKENRSHGKYTLGHLAPQQATRRESQKDAYCAVTGSSAAHIDGEVRVAKGRKWRTRRAYNERRRRITCRRF